MWSQEKIVWPKISIVTACYNHGNYIGETIESIISQGYPNLEYIILDDGSTDQSWEVIKRYKEKVTHIEHMHGHRDTPVIALNKGFGMATGEIMMWINSDDILLPKSLFVVAKLFAEHSEVDWLTGMATTINSRSEIVNSKLRLKHVYDFLTQNWKIIQQESTFWRRSLWEKTGGKLDGEKKWAFDTELWTRFFLHTKHYHINTPIGAFRSGQQSKSVSNMDSFLTPSHFYLKRFEKKMSTKKSMIFLYRICRYLSPIIGFIPDRFFSTLPILSQFCYLVFEYVQSQDVWKLKKINPFRMCK